MPAADTGPELLTAARKGQADRIRALLVRKAPIEAKDRQGRTPLMLAAEHGHADAVRALLDAGASPSARDREGATAFALALLSSSGGREAVLKLLPAPKRIRATLEARLSPENLYSSCLMSLQQLGAAISEIRPEALVLAAVREVAANPGLPPEDVPIDWVDAAAGARVLLAVRPQVSCVQQQSADNLSLAIDVRVSVEGREAPVLEKTFGGGLKGLHVRRAGSPAQYGALFSDWARGHAAAVYWAAVGALLEAAP
jgi:ankyrin repeat protein